MATPILNRSEIANTNLLAQAAEAGNIASVELLLMAGYDVDAATEAGMTALMVAAKFGHAEIVDALLKYGARINQERIDGCTALFFAVFFGQIDVVKLLLERGANPAIKSRFETSLEMWANARGFSQIAELVREVRATKPSEQAFEAAETEDSLAKLAPSAKAEHLEIDIEAPGSFANEKWKGSLAETAGETLELWPQSDTSVNEPAEMLSPPQQSTLDPNAVVPARDFKSALTNSEPSRSSAVAHRQSARHYDKAFEHSSFLYQQARILDFFSVIKVFAQMTSNWRWVTVTMAIVILACGAGSILFLKIGNARTTQTTSTSHSFAAVQRQDQINNGTSTQLEAAPQHEVKNFVLSVPEKISDSPSGKTIRGDWHQTHVSKKEARATVNDSVMSPSRKGPISTKVANQPLTSSRQSALDRRPENDARATTSRVEAERSRSVDARTASQSVDSQPNSPILMRAKSIKTKVIQWP